MYLGCWDKEGKLEGGEEEGEGETLSLFATPFDLSKIQNHCHLLFLLRIFPM